MDEIYEIAPFLVLSNFESSDYKFVTFHGCSKVILEDDDYDTNSAKKKISIDVAT